MSIGEDVLSSMHDPRLVATLEQWRDWPVSQQPAFVKSFDAGLSHQTFLLKADNKQWVLKLFRQPHAQAINIQQWAAKNALAPNILYFDSAYSYCLMEYCDGGQCGNVSALAGKLKLLHTQSVPPVFSKLGSVNFVDIHQRYLANADREVMTVHQQLLPAMELFFSDSNSLCCCHNDLVTENYMEQNAQPVFIDWEYAQLNNPWFDIASVFYYFKLDHQAQVRFMQTYNEELVEQLQQPIYAAALCTVLWTNILWHLDKGKATEWSRLQEKLDQLRVYANQLGLSI